MPSLFSSFRVAPGLRLSTTRRGLRAHVGPRAARLHLGGGRGGVSTGAGPFTLYEPLGGGASRAPARGDDKAALHRQVAQALSQLETAHQLEIPAVERATAPRPVLPKFSKLLATAEKDQLRSVARFDRAARKEARSRARQQAERWALDLLRLAEAEVRSKQQEFDRQWQLLIDNDPPTVVAAVSAALSDARASAQVLGVAGGDVSIGVAGPSDDEVPRAKPTVTSSGAPSVARMNKSDRAAWEAQIVAARVLLVAKQACAVAPGLRGVRLVVTRPESDDPILACVIRCDRLKAADFGEPAWDVLEAVADEVLAKPRGRARELSGISLVRTAFSDLA